MYLSPFVHLKVDKVTCTCKYRCHVVLLRERKCGSTDMVEQQALDLTVGPGYAFCTSVSHKKGVICPAGSTSSFALLVQNPKCCFDRQHLRICKVEWVYWKPANEFWRCTGTSHAQRRILIQAHKHREILMCWSEGFEVSG